MKTKTFFKSAMLVLLLTASMSARAVYVKDPTLCNGMTASWDATARTFTLSNLKPGIIEPYCAWVTDPSFCSNCYVDITPYGTYIPGATSFKTIRLATNYGDPLNGGTNGSSFLFIVIN